MKVRGQVSWPKYFARGGVTTLKKHGAGLGSPFRSSLPYRNLFTGSWCDNVNPKEQEALEEGRRVFERAGFPALAPPFPR